MVTENNSKYCNVNIRKIEEHFITRFSERNNNIITEYVNKISNEEKLILDDTFSAIITKEEVAKAIKGMRVDTAPGPDHVFVRSIKKELAAECISLMATRMLNKGEVPPCLKKARTVLVYKKGDVTDINNWRPITICSVTCFRQKVKDIYYIK